MYGKKLNLTLLMDSLEDCSDRAKDASRDIDDITARYVAFLASYRALEQQLDSLLAEARRMIQRCYDE